MQTGPGSHLLPSAAGTDCLTSQVLSITLKLPCRICQLVQLEGELIGVLHDALEGLHKFCGVCAVHDPVVACQVDRHLSLHANAAVGVRSHCGLAGPYRNDAGGAWPNQTTFS